MRDRPIIFSGPMVRALLEGRKTQTRRVMPDQTLFRACADGYEIWTGFLGWQPVAWAMANRADCGRGTVPSYTPGDRFWVREAFCHSAHSGYDAKPGFDIKTGENSVWYRATDAGQCEGPWRPSIHMFRWASRLTLVVTDVRVQRLQEISGLDISAEGVRADMPEPRPRLAAGIAQVSPLTWNNGKDFTDRAGFRRLWNSLNAKRGYGWETNPWVCALTFEVHHCNIDAMKEAA
jgi:hypothetical protein